jgi:MFS transporter, SP family, general alpha glucoside:H+ symporter
MEENKVVPTENELNRFEFGSSDTMQLIRRAQESDAADRKLTLFEALSKYRKAVIWSCLLSTALVMEG